MSKGRIKRIFPGGNTSLGFFSFYDNILKQDEARRIFVLKGGPGVGKSTFIKKIGLAMADMGYDIEYLHCSSDNDSLDGVVIPALKVAVIDGTAPHVVDPKDPGAVDEIIHLGDFWDEDGMVKNKSEILEAGKKVGRLFARAYRYIRAAAAIYEDVAAIYGRAVDNAMVNITAAELVRDLFGDIPIASEEGSQRHMFASAITPGGLRNYLDSILTTGRVYVVKGHPGTGTEKLLEKIRAAAVERGFYTESFYCALLPTKLEHLVIPKLNISFSTFNKYHSADIPVYKVVDLDEFLDKGAMEEDKEALEYDTVHFEALLDKAVNTIATAKAVHDRLETYYINNMDFEAVQRCWESTLAKVLAYTQVGVE